MLTDLTHRGLLGIVATCAAAVLLSATPADAAHEPKLIRNINTFGVPVGSAPAVLGTLPANKALIVGRTGSPSTPEYGLWVTDGSGSGTALLAHVRATTQGVRVGGRVYFGVDPSGQTPPQAHLWSSDGTVVGTGPVVPAAFGSNALDAQPLAAFGSRLIFSAFYDKRELYLHPADGTTSAGINLTTGRVSYHSGLTIAGAKFYFVARTVAGQYQIWISDGTPAGTQAVTHPWGATAIAASALHDPHSLRQVGNVVLYLSDDQLWGIDVATDTLFAVTTASGTPGSGPPRTAPDAELFAFDDHVLFIGNSLSTASRTLWRSDGTPAGTSPVVELDAKTSPAAQKVGERLVFVADDSHGPQVWGSDGTPAGTVSLGIAVPTIGTKLSGMVPLGTLGSTNYFVVAAGTNSTSWRLWRTDATVGGTRSIMSIPQFVWPPKAFGSNDVATVRANGDDQTVYFEIPSGSKTRSLYKYDPASGAATTLSSTLGLIARAPAVYEAGSLYFTNDSPGTGDEPWVSDGTAAGTRQIADLNPQTQDIGSGPDEFTDFGGRLAFVATDDAHGRELWISDGTAAGTTVLADLDPGPGSSNPRRLFVFQNALFFFASDAAGTMRLWRIGSDAIPHDLAALSTQEPWLREIHPSNAGPMCAQDAPLEFQGRLYFATQDVQNGLELWSSDGTAAGTSLLKDLNPDHDQGGAALGSNPCGLTAFQNRIYFLARAQIWVSDGTAQGTAPVVEMVPANKLAADAGGLYAFEGNKINVTVWRSNGTAAGTTQLLSDRMGEWDDAPSLVIPMGSLGGRFLFSAEGYSVAGVWTTDGTASGTVRAAPVAARAAAVRDGLAYFDGLASIWVSNGTVAGTHVLKNLGSSSVDWIENFNGVTLFETQASGRQLWSTDGTEAGTTQVAALSPLNADPDPLVLAYSSSARQRLAIGNTFFFAIAGDVNTGTELYALTNELPSAAPDTATVQGGGSGSINVLANDSDSDGALLPGSVVISSSAARGQVTVTAGGLITYAPSSGFQGTDVFSYTVMDDLGGRSKPTTVTISVTPAVIVEGKRGGGGALGIYAVLALLALTAARANGRIRARQRSL